MPSAGTFPLHKQGVLTHSYLLASTSSEPIHCTTHQPNCSAKEKQKLREVLLKNKTNQKQEKLTLTFPFCLPRMLSGHKGYSEQNTG